MHTLLITCLFTEMDMSHNRGNYPILHAHAIPIAIESTISVICNVLVVQSRSRITECKRLHHLQGRPVKLSTLVQHWCSIHQFAQHGRNISAQ